MIDFTSLISRRSALAVGASGLSIGLIGLSGLRPLPAQNPAQGFTFALIGDLGYVPSEEPWLENVFTELSKDTALSFVVHVGDLSSPRYGCTAGAATCADPKLKRYNFGFAQLLEPQS
jgi:hypothetical protein